jgi:glycogen phosphorylase
VRIRLARQLGSRGHPPEIVAGAADVLEPSALTLGFVRRFTGYKRPNLLLEDEARLARLVNDPARPVQLVLAGKAHPADGEGKELIRRWIELAQRPEFRRRVVFLEDYDIALAQELVQGVDVWVNTPRRPWEACGTSGMKVLVNGGLNLSERDGWWAEAYAPELGWAIGDDHEYPGNQQDLRDAEALYAILEEQVVPEFYDRDAEGVPRHWLARVRRSMAQLAPVYSSGRMARDYVEQYYLPGAAELRRRIADASARALGMRQWELRLKKHWTDLRITAPTISRDGCGWLFSVTVELGQIAPKDVAVQLYAEPCDGGAPFVGELFCTASGASRVYTGAAPADRPARDYTVRIVPRHPGAAVPAELSLILWQN